ncbi:hypothetical protein niasHS_001056 [Heterodera schachtii]|uniref:BTB domain-containing protein n=1 Tax=Heterodera schachtii TaxID=97005 RepID=A0ABD2K8N2_HETSC
MEPKRMKMAIPTPSSPKKSTSTYDPRRIIEALKIFRGEPTKTHAELLQLKRHLDSKERVLAFLEYDNKSAYRALLSRIIAMANDIFVSPFEHGASAGQNLSPQLPAQQQIVCALRETFSVVANMCHLSVLACIEACSSNFDNLFCVFIRVLEPKKQAEEQLLSSLRCPALRLIGNLCELKETATYVAISAHLMELVAMCVSSSSSSEGESAGEADTDASTTVASQLSAATERRQEEEQALRVLRLLATRRKHLKYIVRCNGIAKIATFIVRRHHSGESIFTGRPDLIQLLTYVLRFYPTQVGDQLSTSAECVELFLQFLLDHPRHRQQNANRAHHLTELFLRCVHSSHTMRYQLGHDAITTILRSDETTLSDVHCRFLCCFLKDVHGRAWLRESGGLDRILCRLATAEQCDDRRDLLRLQQFIVTDLKSILHDHALLLTINHPNFLPTAIAQINRFLEENLVECETVGDAHNQHESSDANVQHEDQMVDHKSDGNRKRHGTDEPLCKDFSASTSAWPSHSPAASPPSTRGSVAWSPSMSPSTDPQFSLSPSASPPSDHGQFWLDDYLVEGLKTKAMSPPLQEDAAPEELETDDPSSFLERKTIMEEEEDESDIEEFADHSNASASAGDGPSSSSADGKALAERKKVMKIRAKIVDALLTLITTFSHLDERQSIVLISENVIRALVRHVSEAPAMDNRLCRALRRLARHQMGLQKMLEIDFYQMVIRHLIRRQCTLTRFAPLCTRCDFRRDFGRRLLGDHALLADSSMGEHLLLRLRLEEAVAGGAEWERVRSLAAALVLLRKDERRIRLHHNFQPIDVLLEFVGRLVKETATKRRSLDQQSAEGRLCCDILSAFSALLKHHQHIFEDFGGENGPKEAPKDDKSVPEMVVEPAECVLLRPTNNAVSDQLTLKFRDTNGSLVAEVPKDDLCTFNEYFMGMFGSEFLERLTGRDQFVFDSDAECCSREEFVKFLHFSIGCGLQSECVQVNSAECCVAMLRLADKYLCIRLLDHLLQSGKASRFITGHTLRLFLPLVLSVPTVGDGGGLSNVCALVLLRYCTDAQALDALRLLAERDADCAAGPSTTTVAAAVAPFAPALSLVDSLCDALRAFVRPYAELTTPQRARGPGVTRESSLDTSAYWDFS